MADRIERSDRRQLAIVGHPIFSMLMPVPIVCFLGALAADLAYMCSENLLWLNFSSWLILMGLVSGAIAGLFLIIDFVRLSALRAIAGWSHLLLYFGAWLIELFNMLVHNRDGWTAVVPTGLTLSIIAVLLILIAGWLARPAVVEVVR
ncbi:MAG TPA: DUF2231 domain-containing protein [Sphingomicrobium sp.]|nr:DUF2231 domain-containing protein [Sphingomicrobium sp.]